MDLHCFPQTSTTVTPPPAQHLKLSTNTAKARSGRAFTPLKNCEVPKTGDARWFSAPCFATASITLSAKLCLNMNYWIRFIFCKYYCYFMDLGINESKDRGARIQHNGFERGCYLSIF